MAPGVRVRLKLTSTVTLPVQGDRSSDAPIQAKAAAGTQKRLLLNGYVQRLTFPAAIVECLRSGECKDFSILLPPWDDNLDLPPAEPALQGDASPSQLARPTKRCRKANPPPAALDVPLEPDQAMEVQPTPLQPVKPAKVDQHPGDSNSNEATNTEQILYPPQSVSPTEVSAQHSLPKAILRSAPALPLPAPRATSLPPMLRGVSTAAQAGPSTLLPPCLLHLQGANDSLSSAFNSLGPNDLLLPNSVCCPTGQQGSQTHLDWLISAARGRKREGDALRGSGPWHMPSVSSMVEASLMFMEACDEKLRCPPSSQDRLQSVALLYQQTSSLLQWTSRACETMQSREAVKEALRILCERLTMTCLLREAQLTHGSLRQYADKVDLLVKTQQQRSQQPGTTAVAPPPTAAKQVPCTGTQPSAATAAAAAAAAAGAKSSQTAVVAAPAPRLQFPRRTAQPAVPVQASQQLAQQRPDSQQLRQNGPHQVSAAAVEQAASKATQQAQQAASKAAASKAAASKAAASKAAAAAAAQQAASKAAAAAQQQAQLSPVDSVTSCQEQVALAQSAAPMPRPVQINVSVELGAFQGKLLQSGRSVAKYAELLRKSTLGFQALLERPDIRASQAAKSACMHMAALCMDVGMGPPSRVVAHARLALNSLKQMATQS